MSHFATILKAGENRCGKWMLGDAGRRCEICLLLRKDCGGFPKADHIVTRVCVTLYLPHVPPHGELIMDLFAYPEGAGFTWVPWTRPVTPADEKIN